MIEGANQTLVWLLPLLGFTILLQRGMSFLLPRRFLEAQFLKRLNRFLPMAVIALLVFSSLNGNDSIHVWRAIGIEAALLASLALVYVLTNRLMLVILLAAAAHWALVHYGIV